MVVMNSGDGLITFKRSTCSYDNASHKFLVGTRTYEKQYAPFYNVRLSTLSDKLKETVKQKWGKKVSIKRLCDISIGEDVAVIGTLFKHMELRPSILKEISEEHHLIPQASGHCYAADDDFLILEDDVQRITLKGNIDPSVHVTGIIAAVLGSEQEDGKFKVTDICYYSVKEPISRPLFEADRYVMLVSGLGIGSANILFSLRLLVDYVTGFLGESPDQEKISSLVRIIVAGNSISESLKDMDFSNKAKYLTRKVKASTVDAMKELDDFLADLAASIDVDIMPGEYDPANHLLPQQPLHYCMFPKASTYSSFHSVTNPYEVNIGGVRFLGSSGQNIKDIISYSKLDNSMDIMENTLKWGHLMPTAPDSLNCFPCCNKDPFVIEDSPHVYFAGSMDKLDVRKFGSGKYPITMIAVPKFCNTFTAVLVNLKTLTAEPLEFLGL